MSIFPKRTLRDSRVSIHWNFNTAHLKEHSICPLVRIGVQDPLGEITWLLEKHMLALPAISREESRKEGQFLYLNKNTPLMVMADYLSGKQKKKNWWRSCRTSSREGIIILVMQCLQMRPLANTV